MSKPTAYSPVIKTAEPFLFLGDEKYWVRGVTYGTFRPDKNGDQFPPRQTVRADFEAMLSAGTNTVRTYTPPPLWLLDLAQELGLRVMVGHGRDDRLMLLKNAFNRPIPIGCPSLLENVVQLVDQRGEQHLEQLILRCFCQQRVELKIEIRQPVSFG